MAGISQVVSTVAAYDKHRTPRPSPLRLLRAVNGLSASRLAALADIDRSTVWRLEEGIGHPQRRTARKLAAVLNCPVELLFPENDESAPPVNGTLSAQPGDGDAGNAFAER